MTQSKSSSNSSASTGSNNPRSSSSMGKSGGPTPQIVLIELKQRILAALNKLADRDTQHIAVEELERIAETLTPEGISLCLSCLYDTDLPQKNAVRKECVKMFGTLAFFHNDLMAPHLPKIVTNIVRRLRDPDSSIRDACVDAMGTLAAKVSSGACTAASLGGGGGGGGGGAEGALATFAGPLGVFSKPLFDALNEQHRGVQVGAAMCLAGVIDNFKGLPSGSLQRLCPRIIKLLNSSTFSAKAALLSVIASIVQAGGVTSHQCLAMVMACVQDCLKSNDWATRKAASETLACAASSIGAPLGSFKLQVLEALEACRFDKVKPVRDTVVQTLQIWKRISTSEMPSDRTAVKENSHIENPDYEQTAAKKNDGLGDALKRMTSPYQSLEGCFGFGHTRSGPNKISSSNNQKKRMPLTDKEANPEFFQKLDNKEGVADWQVDIAIPKVPIAGTADVSEVELPKQLANKEQKLYQEHTNTGRKSLHGDVETPDRQELQVTTGRRAGELWDRMQASNTVIENHVFEESIGMSSSKSHSFKPECDSGSWVHRGGLVSSSSSISEGRSCGTPDNDSAFIRKQLSQLEDQQLKLLELLQKFMNRSEESFLKLEARVNGVEGVVGNLVRRLDDLNGRSCTSPFTNADNFWKKGESYHHLQDRSIHSESIPSGRNGRVSQLRSSAESGITGEEPRFGPATCAPLATNSFSEAQANSWRVHVDVSTESLLRRTRNEAEGNHFLGKKAPARLPSSSKLGEGPSARSIWQASKDEATLAAIRVAGEDARLNPKTSETISSQSSVETRLESTGQKIGGQGKGSFWSLWSRAAEFLRSGDVDSAYVEVLCAGDELLLVRLMSRTGPVLEQLLNGTVHELLRMIVQLLLQQSFLDVILPWMQQVADLVLNAGPDCMGLSFDAKRGLLASLEEASGFEYSELWVAKTLRELTVQLSTSWGLALSR